jgi:uncharacterized protein YqeY
MVVDETPAERLKRRLRHDLGAALKAKQRDEATALRILIGAIDNAESVEDQGAPSTPEAAAHVAGSVEGVGAGDLPRRLLSEPDLRRIIATEVSELREQAERFAAHGRDDAAPRIESEAEVLSRYRHDAG